MKTYTKTISGTAELGDTVRHLLSLSCWFAVEPMPDDEYEVRVKAEMADKAFPGCRGPYAQVAELARLAIENDKAGMTGVDPVQFGVLVELGNRAGEIIELAAAYTKLLSILQSLADESWLDETGTETPYLRVAKEAARDALGVEP